MLYLHGNSNIYLIHVVFHVFSLASDSWPMAISSLSDERMNMSQQRKIMKSFCRFCQALTENIQSYANMSFPSGWKRGNRTVC